MSLTPEQRLYRIVEEGLCIGCGLCQSVAGPDRVQVVPTVHGDERPVVVGELDDTTVERIYDVCPGVHVQGLPESEISERTLLDNVWGPWRRIVRCWAGDPQIRFEGSTGGVLTALAQWLLGSGRVDFIAHARANDEVPGFGQHHLSFTADDVVHAAGSRYGSTAPLIDIAAVLDRSQPFAFIGKPCDIAGLRNYARHDPRVDELVRYWLTPVCGGFMPAAGLAAFYRRIGVQPDAVTALRYRGRGCPGPTRIETGATATEVHYLDLWGEDSSSWQLPFRCKVCPDGIGEAADIAAADSWPGGSPDRGESETDPGTNAVVARTARGAELLEAAAADGALVLEHDVSPDEMSHYQLHQMRKKYAAGARFQGLRDEGRLAPKTQRLRIDELSRELPAEVFEQQRQGTRQRVRDGKATEPRPVPAETIKARQACRQANRPESA